jgi:hypothetical protein
MSPMKRELYPANWPEIRAQVKERAGNKCEGCGVANHAVGARDKRGDWHNQEDIDHLNSDVRLFDVWGISKDHPHCLHDCPPGSQSWQQRSGKPEILVPALSQSIR